VDVRKVLLTLCLITIIQRQEKKSMHLTFGKEINVSNSTVILMAAIRIFRLCVMHIRCTNSVNVFRKVEVKMILIHRMCGTRDVNEEIGLQGFFSNSVFSIKTGDTNVCYWH
jgi:hypothetical protein